MPRQNPSNLRGTPGAGVELPVRLRDDAYRKQTDSSISSSTAIGHSPAPEWAAAKRDSYRLNPTYCLVPPRLVHSLQD